MKIQCPGCGAKLNVPDDRAGQTGRCPRCGQAIPIVAEGAGTGAVAQAFDAEPVAEASGIPLPRLATKQPAAQSDTATATAPASAESKPKKKKKKKKKGSDGALLERFESLKGWQMAGLAVGAIGVLVLAVVLIVTVLTPAVDAALDAAYSAPPAASFPEKNWHPADFGPRGRVQMPGGTQQGKVIASAVIMTVHEFKPNDDVVFAIATAATGLPPDRMQMKPDELLNDFCDGFRNNVHAQGGTELSRRSFRMGDLPAVEMISRVPAARGKLVHRAIFADNELYVLVAGGKGYTPKHPDIRKFLDSFELRTLGGRPLAAPPVRSNPEQQADAVAKLKQIGAAIKAYEVANKTFPPDAFTDDKGTPTLSWRVAILPHLGHSDLYDQFHFDEPWDSPNNKPLIAKMPAIFAPTSSQNIPAGETPFQAFVDASGVFDPMTLHGSADVTDGIARTLIVAETSATIPWTKPEDIAVARGIPALGTHYGAGFLTLAADGEVYSLPADIDHAKLRAAITRAGGEPGAIGDLKTK